MAELRQENEEIRAAADRNDSKLCHVERHNRAYLADVESLRQQVDRHKKEAQKSAALETRVFQVEAQLEACQKNLSELRKIKKLEEKVELLERDLTISKQREARLQKQSRSQTSVDKEKTVKKTDAEATFRKYKFLATSARNLRTKNNHLESMVKQLQSLVRKQK